ncbi:MAG: hypothetical protein JST00_26270 [Deltaproteobacteria bacterium]|nr:hypothetical protein [Deltaproteobacteria bacterium]
MARVFNVSFFALATGLTALLVACGSTTIVAASADSGADAGVDEVSPPEVPVDSSVEPPSPVTEKPSPACHDLVQRGELVSIVANPAPTPKEKPLSAIPPGLYTAVSSIEYGTSGPIDWPAVRTTVYVSSTRFYALIEGDQPRVAATFSWAIRGGMLERTYLCSSVGWREKTFAQRIDPSENGFTIFTPGVATVDGEIATRYVRVDP